MFAKMCGSKLRSLCKASAGRQKLVSTIIMMNKHVRFAAWASGPSECPPRQSALPRAPSSSSLATLSAPCALLPPALLPLGSRHHQRCSRQPRSRQPRCSRPPFRICSSSLVTLGQCRPFVFTLTTMSASQLFIINPRDAGIRTPPFTVRSKYAPICFSSPSICSQSTSPDLVSL